MTMKFAPHVQHVADQQRENREADAEYAMYKEGMKRLQDFLPDMKLPQASREEYENMRDLLAARYGVPA
jgi:hypothetical protein